MPQAAATLQKNLCPIKSFLLVIESYHNFGPIFITITVNSKNDSSCKLAEIQDTTKKMSHYKK